MRKIPHCSHFFHIDCIDAWLKTHDSCPLCRLSLRQEGPPEDRSDAVESPATPQQQERTAEGSSGGLQRIEANSESRVEQSQRGTSHH